MNDVKLQILLDAKEQTDAAFAKVNANMQKLGGAANLLKGAFAGMLAGVSLGAVVSGINKVADAASDMQETVSKVNTLFGGSQGAVLQEWAAGAAKSMGLAKQEALDAVGTMGNMFLQLGANTQKAADLSTGMVDLSADIASFHNVAGGANEVLGAMQAAFRGEYDALQRYIPTINAAAVEQEALGATGKKTAKELSALEKAMAAYAIITRDAGAATGDFERTSAELANQRRILDAQMKDFSANVGSTLLPAYTKLISQTNTWVAANSALITQKVDVVIDGTTSAMKRMLDVYNQVPSEITSAAGYGLIGRVVFGGWGPAKMVAALAYINETMAHFNANFGSIGKSWRELGKIASDAMAELERSTRKIPSATMMSSHGKVDMLMGAHSASAGSSALAVTANRNVAEMAAINSAAIKEQENFWDEWNDVAVKGLDAYDKSIIDGYAETEAAFKQMQQTVKDNAVTFELDTWFSDLDSAEEKLRETSKRMSELSQHTAEGMQDAFSDFFFDAMTGKLKGLEDYATAALQAIARAMSAVMAQKVVETGFSALGSLFHSGGVVGTTAVPSRSLPAAVWAAAPRLHGGLMPDEFPAILQRGETVLPRGSAPGAVVVQPQVDIKIYNEIGEAMAVKRQQTSVDGVKTVCELWLEGYNSNRFGLRDAMRAR